MSASASAWPFSFVSALVAMFGVCHCGSSSHQPPPPPPPTSSSPCYITTPDFLSGLFGRFRLDIPNTWATSADNVPLYHGPDLSPHLHLIGHDPSMTSLPARGIAHERCHMTQIPTYIKRCRTGHDPKEGNS
jgi:hypothetical protein